MAEPHAGTITIRAQLRASEHDARRLISRAAHIEKRAQRAPPDSPENLNLNAIALELRAAAGELLIQASELSRTLKGGSTTPALRP